jgi:hypothetical protein
MNMTSLNAVGLTLSVINPERPNPARAVTITQVGGSA